MEFHGIWWIALSVVYCILLKSFTNKSKRKNIVNLFINHANAFAWDLIKGL